MPFNWFAHSATQKLYRRQFRQIVGLYGVPCFYLPRTVVNRDDFYGEDSLSQWDTVKPLKLFLENFDFFEGAHQLYDRWNMSFQDEMRFTIEILHFTEQTGLQKPVIGDLIAFELGKNLSIYNPNNRGYEMFEIKGLEPKRNFYSFGTMYLYELYCEKYEVSGETFQTGNAEIDSAMGAVDVDNLSFGANAAIDSMEKGGVRQYNQQTEQYETIADVVGNKQDDPMKLEREKDDLRASLSGMIAYWRFEEMSYSGAAGEVIDTTGNYDGVASASVVTLSASGKVGRYAYFNGESDSYISTGYTPTSEAKTLAVWLRYGSFDMTNDNIIGVDTAGKKLYVGVDVSGNLAIGYGSSSIGGSSKYKIFSGFLSDRWYRVVMTHAEEEGILYVYVNGNCVTKFFASMSSGSGSAEFLIGAINDEGSVRVLSDVLVDEVVIDSTLWTDEMVRADFNNGSGRIVT